MGRNQMAQHLKSDEQISWLYQHLSMSYLQNNQFTTALEKINESIKYSHNDSVYLLYVWATKGLIFNDLQQYDQPIIILKKVKELTISTILPATKRNVQNRRRLR